MALSNQTKEIIKATIPVLHAHGTAIVQQFYDNLFIRYPSVKRQFNVDKISSKDGTPAQVSALANAVLLYANKIDKLGDVLPLLRPIAEKHVSRGVTAEQYDAVGECLLMAMKQVLGDAATEEILSAWEDAYTVLKDVFIGMENEIRKTNETKAGWSGMKTVTVKDIGSRDGKRFLKFDVVPDCQPGMFVSVGVKIHDEETMTSVKIIERGDGLIVMLEEEMERATKALFSLSVGDRVSISVPCGVPRDLMSFEL